ncbi:MAG: lamin tail domain-containing protein [Myxococcota bacterium]
MRRTWWVLTTFGFAACSPHLAPPAARPEAARAGGALRVMTWNIETVGDPGDLEYDAALQMLARIDADVVALQEVAYSQDVAPLDQLAEDAGYELAVLGTTGFGNDLNAVLTRLPVIDAAAYDGATASGDARADDLTRDIVVASLDAGAFDFTIAVGHLKSGTGDTNEFRRAVDERRAMQALFDVAGDHAIFCGDLNEDLGDRPPSPAVFHTLPSGLPSSYFLGQDLYDELTGPGLPNAPFAAFVDRGLQAVPALQLDGLDETRTSGRRLDYLFVSADLADGALGEVYDTEDEGLGGGLPKAGAVPTYTTLQAADHFPVFADVPLGDGGGDGAVPAAPGNLELTEVMADPSACSDAEGEWVEVHNVSGEDVDLSGMLLGDAQGRALVGGGGIVPAGGYAVLARTVGACGVPAVSGTFTAQLANAGDEVGLYTASGAVIDRFSWTSTRSGESWSRDGGVWCSAAGSPAAPNPGC